MSDKEPNNELDNGAAEIPKSVGKFKKPADSKEGSINVVAIEKGYYGQNRIEPGKKFTIKSEQEFSEIWMQKI